MDNVSTDNSLDLLDARAECLPFLFHIRSQTVRTGVLARHAIKVQSWRIGDYLLFLDPDARLFEDSLTKPFSFMQQPSNSGIGICGIRLVDEDGNTSTSAARFPTFRVMAGKILGLTKLFPSMFPAHLMTSSDLRKSGLADEVIGAFFLIRQNVFDRCGGFDERFFVYFEEVDLSLRAKQLGYSSYFLSEVMTFPKGGGCSERVKADRLFYSLCGRIHYARKHYSWMEFVALVLLTGLELPFGGIRGRDEGFVVRY